MTVFHFHYEKETDTDTTLIIDSAQEAATLDEALGKVSDALGGRLNYLTAHADEWLTWIVRPGYQRYYVRACHTCGGLGTDCETCGGTGYVSAQFTI